MPFLWQKNFRTFFFFNIPWSSLDYFLFRYEIWQSNLFEVITAFIGIPIALLYLPFLERRNIDVNCSRVLMRTFVVTICIIVKLGISWNYSHSRNSNERNLTMNLISLFSCHQNYPIVINLDIELMNMFLL